MSKRHDLGLWKQISHVTAVLSEANKLRIYRFKYVRQEHEGKPLFEYARDYVTELVDNDHPEKIEADMQFQKIRSRRNITEYCMLQAYKIVWLMEIF